MENHLEYKDNRVVISDELRKQPLFIKLYEKDKSQNKKSFYDFITYLYFVYWKKSVYRSFFITDRKKYVCRERLKCEPGTEEFVYNKYEEDDSLYKLIINWYIANTKSAEERLMDTVLLKIEEYITYVSSYQIDSTNQDSYIKLMKGSNELFDLRDSIEKRVYKEAQKRGQNNAQPSFIEQKNSKNTIGQNV